MTEQSPDLGLWVGNSIRETSGYLIDHPNMVSTVNMIGVGMRSPGDIAFVPPHLLPNPAFDHDFLYGVSQQLDNYSFAHVFGRRTSVEGVTQFTFNASIWRNQYTLDAAKVTLTPQGELVDENRPERDSAEARELIHNLIGDLSAMPALPPRR